MLTDLVEEDLYVFFDNFRGKRVKAFITQITDAFDNCVCDVNRVSWAAYTIPSGADVDTFWTLESLRITKIGEKKPFKTISLYNKTDLRSKIQEAKNLNALFIVVYQRLRDSMNLLDLPSELLLPSNDTKVHFFLDEGDLRQQHFPNNTSSASAPPTSVKASDKQRPKKAAAANQTAATAVTSVQSSDTAAPQQRPPDEATLPPFITGERRLDPSDPNYGKADINNDDPEDVKGYLLMLGWHREGSFYYAANVPKTEDGRRGAMEDTEKFDSWDRLRDYILDELQLKRVGAHGIDYSKHFFDGGKNKRTSRLLQPDPPSDSSSSNALVVATSKQQKKSSSSSQKETYGASFFVAPPDEGAAGDFSDDSDDDGKMEGDVEEEEEDDGDDDDGCHLVAPVLVAVNYDDDLYFNHNQGKDPFFPIDYSILPRSQVQDLDDAGEPIEGDTHSKHVKEVQEVIDAVMPMPAEFFQFEETDAGEVIMPTAQDLNRNVSQFIKISFMKMHRDNEVHKLYAAVCRDFLRSILHSADHAIQGRSLIKILEHLGNII